MTRKALWILILAAALCLGWWQGSKAKASGDSVCGQNTACLSTSCQSQPWPAIYGCSANSNVFPGCVPVNNNSTGASSPTNGYTCQGTNRNGPCSYFIPYCSGTCQ
jgi:hypothetical protein